MDITFEDKAKDEVEVPTCIDIIGSNQLHINNVDKKKVFDDQLD